MEKIGSEINRLTGQDLTIDITPSTAKLRQLANSYIVKTLDPADTNALLGLADDDREQDRAQQQHRAKRRQDQ